MTWLKALGIFAFWWLAIGTAAALAADTGLSLAGVDQSIAAPLLITVCFVVGVVQAIRYVRSGGKRGRLL